MAVRRPRRVTLPEAAYVAPEAELVPECVSDLEKVPGRCYSTESVVLSCPAVPGIVCAACCLAELGETMHHLSIRTANAIPKARYYREVDAALARPDPEWRRQFDRSRG